jgi:VanZ family protein
MNTFFRAGLVLHLGLVVVISVSAYAGVIPTSFAAVPHLDLLGHAILIGGIAFFLDGALGHRGITRESALPLAPVIVLAVAGVEEYLQRLSPRRSSSWSDFAADVVGVCFFTWLARRVSERRSAAAALTSA